MMEVNVLHFQDMSLHPRDHHPVVDSSRKHKRLLQVADLDEDVVHAVGPASSAAGTQDSTCPTASFLDGILAWSQAKSSGETIHPQR